MKKIEYPIFLLIIICLVFLAFQKNKSVLTSPKLSPTPAINNPEDYLRNLSTSTCDNWCEFSRALCEVNYYAVVYDGNPKDLYVNRYGNIGFSEIDDQIQPIVVKKKKVYVLSANYYFLGCYKPHAMDQMIFEPGTQGSIFEITTRDSESRAEVNYLIEGETTEKFCQYPPDPIVDIPDYFVSRETLEEFLLRNNLFCIEYNPQDGTGEKIILTIYPDQKMKLSEYPYRVSIENQEQNYCLFKAIYDREYIGGGESLDPDQTYVGISWSTMKYMVRANLGCSTKIDEKSIQLHLKEEKSLRGKK